MMKGDVAKLLKRRVLPPDAIHQPDEMAQRPRIVKIPMAKLILLIVEVFFNADGGDVDVDPFADLAL